MTLELDKTKNWGLVAYTDGGARPNPGASGCGMHAYLYDIDEETKIKPIKFSDGEAIRYAFTSAVGYIYCSKTGEVSSAANANVKPVTAKHIVTMAESSSNQHTNNYAEMKSLLNGIRLGISHGVKRIFIVTDSEYANKGLTLWCEGWVKNNWMTSQGEPVKNADLWKVLYKEYREALDSGVAIKIQWVKGHRNHPGNTQADHLATIGVLKSMQAIDDNSIRYYSPKEYWEPKRDRHPLLSLKRMYFNRDKDRNVPGTYYMADPGKDDALIGKPLPETVFAVVKMKEPVPIIQSILDAQGRYGQEFNATMMIRMESIYDPYAYHLLSEHGDKALLRAKNGSHVVLPDARQITIERNPIGITMRALDSINSLEAILDRYLEMKEDGYDSLLNNIDLQAHDVTDELYDKEEKTVKGEVIVKRTLKKTIVVGQKTFSITRDIGSDNKCKTITFPLRLGADMPDRNSLKQLEVFNPKVELITWRESEKSLRYAAVLTCNDGIAIWSNFYADRLVFKD